MKINIEEIQSRLTIDKDNLEQEILEQPNFYFLYGVMCAEAQKELNNAEEYEKVTRSEIFKELKASPEKMTEKQIEAEYRTDPRHLDAVKKTTESQFNYDVLSAAQASFAQRKYMLELLAKNNGSTQNGNVENTREEIKKAVKVRRFKGE